MEKLPENTINEIHFLELNKVINLLNRPLRHAPFKNLKTVKMLFVSWLILRIVSKKMLLMSAIKWMKAFRKTQPKRNTK